MFSARHDGFGCDDVHDGFLERGAYVFDDEFFPGCFAVLNIACYGGLQPGEAEVVAARPRFFRGSHELARCESAREADRFPVALGRQLVDHGATRIAQPQQAGDFIVGLPRGVVDGGSQHRDVRGQRIHFEDLGVAARN